MKCPECGRKLSTKNYDATYEWYECPKCEGCFTYDEVLEGGISDESGESEDTEADGNRTGAKGKKARGGRSKKRAHSNGANGSVPETDAEVRERIKSVPIAKGKKRRTEIEEDDLAVEDYTEQIVKNTIRQESHPRHRDEVDSIAVVNLWGDEIQDIYHELGMELDEVNAQDKATILWREIHHLQGVPARDQAVEHTLCEKHA